MRLATWAAAVVAVAAHVSSALAQSGGGLTSGARVRVRGDRATSAGVRAFTTRGVVESVDSTRLVLRAPRADAPLDTIVLLGVRHLDAFAGRRSLAKRIATGAVTAGAAAAAGWFIAKKALSPDKYDVQVADPSTGRSFTAQVTAPVSPLVGKLRTSIPIAAVAGGLIGTVIGAERWLRIPVPQSEYPEAR